MKPIDLHTIEEHTRSLASYLPGGKVFASKQEQDAPLFQILTGLAYENQRAENYLVQLQNDFIPDEAGVFLGEWERVVGIPDTCFTGEGTPQQRARDVLVKLASLGVQTAEDFERVAEIFGLEVTVKPGSSYLGFPLPLPYPFLLTGGKFTIVVEYSSSGGGFPFTFDFEFEAEGILNCLFNKLRPANCQVIFVAV